jgi:hypothetical protein
MSSYFIEIILDEEVGEVWEAPIPNPSPKGEGSLSFVGVENFQPLQEVGIPF